MSIISLRNINLSFSSEKVLNNISFDIHSGSKIALIGRNGSGKSSLLKILAGKISPDSGKKIINKKLSLSYLDQNPSFLDKSSTLIEVVLSGLKEIGEKINNYNKILNQSVQKAKLSSNLLCEMNSLQEEIDKHNAWHYYSKAQKLLSKFSLNSSVLFKNLSGGLKRRTLLVRSLIADPDILFLDEPTNHLDILSINFLESFLNNYKKTVIFVSHNRHFLDSVSSDIIELDRGSLYYFPGSYTQFIIKKQKALMDENKRNLVFDKKLAQEESWLKQGVKARCKRNQGRLKKLKNMREEVNSRKELTRNNILFPENNSSRSSKKIIVADNISFNYPGKCLFENFSYNICRNDRITIIGPNGCGKTTLLNILLKKIKPMRGIVSHPSSIEIVYFDQLREELKENLSIFENISEGSDYVNINGKEFHISSYLRKFSFDDQIIFNKVSVLSGGEKNRLLFAKILSKKSDLMVLDEPTNDLDVETLETLENFLINYSGTILMISHDISLINNISTNTLVFEDNKIIKIVGGYKDWLCYKDRLENTSENLDTKKIKISKNKFYSKERKSKIKLSYNQRKNLEKLPKDIEHIEKEVEDLNKTLSRKNFYKSDPLLIKSLKEKLHLLNDNLEAKYNEWEYLESLK